MQVGSRREQAGSCILLNRKAKGFARSAGEKSLNFRDDSDGDRFRRARADVKADRPVQAVA